jgi:hypothetical protein
VAHFTSVPDWLFSQEDAGRGSATSTATAATAGPGAQPVAAAKRGGHRALCRNQAGECQHGRLPLRARHYADRLQDRTHRYRMQEDAGNEVKQGFTPRFQLPIQPGVNLRD